MRCPKCGSFMEQGRETCLMCGTNVNTYVPENNTSSNAGFNDGFSSGMGTAAVGSNGFSSYGNYNNASASSVNATQTPFASSTYVPPKGKKDIFDFYSEHKTLVFIVSLALFIVIFCLIEKSIYKSRMTIKPREPIFGQLYFYPDESFVLVSDGNNSLVFNKSGDKGSDCSIIISFGASTSGDHVSDYHTSIVQSLRPEVDANGDLIDETTDFTSQEGSFSINNSTWYYLNLFFKEKGKSDYLLAKYKYLTAMYQGFYYDIELLNNSNDAICRSSLDAFVSSLRFIEK